MELDPIGVIVSLSVVVVGLIIYYEFQLFRLNKRMEAENGRIPS